jgi:uncharacterized membrane protein YeiH
MSGIASALAAELASEAPIQVPVWADLAAIGVGALAGALHAERKGLDVIGVLSLAVAGGLGGGIIRDLLIARGTPVALTTPSYVITAALMAVLGFFFARYVARFVKPMIILDALSLALFALVGADKALLNGLTASGAVLVGVATAVGGGILRDLLCGDVPQIVLPGQLYATAALVGALAYVGMADLDVARGLAALITIALVFALRMASVLRGWETPQPVDLPGYLATQGRRWRRRRAPGGA